MNTNVSFASASDTREQKPRLHELAPEVYGYISDFDPNCGFVVGDDQVVLIDTRPTPRMARDFLAAIRTVTDKPIKTIVLTHYHAVRVMGASAFGEVEAIIASHGTLDWIRTRGQADFDSEVGRFPRLFAGVEEIPGLTFPTMSFERQMSLWLGARELRLMCLGRASATGRCSSMCCPSTSRGPMTSCAASNIPSYGPPSATANSGRPCEADLFYSALGQDHQDGGRAARSITS